MCFFRSRMKRSKKKKEDMPVVFLPTPGDPLMKVYQL